MGSITRKVLTILAVALYVFSFFLPTVASLNDPPNNAPQPGWRAFEIALRMLLNFKALELGWWSISAAWLANPLFWVAAGASLFDRRRVARITAWVAVAFCLMVFFFDWFMIINHPGYWCWAGSVVLLAVVNSLRVTTKEKSAIVQSSLRDSLTAQKPC